VSDIVNKANEFRLRYENMCKAFDELQADIATSTHTPTPIVKLHETIARQEREIERLKHSIDSKV
jgi:hypothetical protein